MSHPGITIQSTFSTQRSAADSQSSPVRAAVLIIADSIYSGTRRDRAYQLIKGELEEESIRSESVEVLPNDPVRIKARISELRQNEDIDVIVATGAATETLKSLIGETENVSALPEQLKTYRIPSS